MERTIAKLVSGAAAVTFASLTMFTGIVASAQVPVPGSPAAIAAHQAERAQHAAVVAHNARMRVRRASREAHELHMEKRRQHAAVVAHNERMRVHRADKELHRLRMERKAMDKAPTM